MTKEDYQALSKLEDWQLLELCTGGEQDTRTHAARHLMEIRRADLAARSSQRAVIAARWSAVAACVSALVAMGLVAMMIFA